MVLLAGRARRRRRPRPDYRVVVGELASSILGESHSGLHTQLIILL